MSVAELESFMVEAIHVAPVIGFSVVRRGDDETVLSRIPTAGLEPGLIARRVENTIARDARTRKTETVYSVIAIGDDRLELDSLSVTRNVGALVVAAPVPVDITPFAQLADQNRQLLSVLADMTAGVHRAQNQDKERLQKRIDTLEGRELDGFALREKLLKDWSERERDLATERRWDKLLTKLEPGITALMTHATSGKDGRAPPAIEHHVLAQTFLNMTDEECDALVATLDKLSPETQQRLSPVILPLLELRMKERQKTLEEAAKSAAAAVTQGGPLQ